MSSNRNIRCRQVWGRRPGRPAEHVLQVDGSPSLLESAETKAMPQKRLNTQQLDSFGGSHGR